MALTKGFVRNSGMTALDTRKMLAGMVVTNPDGSPRTGVLATVYGDYRLGDTTSSMAVIMRGAAYVVSRSSGDGAVILTNDGSVTVPLDAAPAANSRIDVVYVKHNDNSDGNGDADASPVFGVAKGTAAADPVRASLPTGALGLFAIRIPAGVTATNASGVTVGNDAQFTAMEGGVINYRTAAAFNADVNNVRAPQLAALLTDNSLWQKVGTAWRAVLLPAFNRNYFARYVTSVSSLANLGTITIAPVPVAQRALVSVQGTAGGNASAGGNIGVAFGISGAGVVATTDYNDRSGPYRPYFSQNERASVARQIILDIPANVTATVTTQADASTTAGVWLTTSVTCSLAGEY